ncbi:MAG TPA: hypothetical protein VGK70_07645 [Thermoanaerobaculia bacterium]
MNRILVLSLAGSIAVTLPADAAEKKFDPCSLLTASEIQAVQADRVASTKGNEPERDRFAVSQCFYTLATFSKSISLEVTRRRPTDAEGPRSYWRQMFGRALEKEKETGQREGRPGEEEKRSSPPQRVEGVGDDAYWVGPPIVGGLYVLKEDTYFRLSVGGPESEAVKIEKLKKLARRVLRRL